MDGKKSLLNSFNSSPTFFLIPFSSFLPKKFYNWLKYFCDEIFAICCLGNYCRFFPFYIAGNLFDARLLEHRLFGIFVKLRRDRGKKNLISVQKSGVHCGSFRGKSKFLLNCSKLQLNCQSGNSSEREDGEKVECALAVAENSDECRGGNLPKFQWNFLFILLSLAIKC